MTKRPLMSANDPRHGQRKGYYAHRSEGSPACGACKRAAAAAEARYVMLRNRGVRSRLDPIGTQRRLQALVALGYTWRAIDQHLGHANMAEKWGNGRLSYVFPGTAAKVSAVYERLSMTLPPNETTREKAAVSKAKGLARRRGWPPPLAWTNIDDPDENPTGWEYRPADRAEHLADLDHRQAGITEVCAELGIRRDSVERWCERHGLRAMYVRFMERETPIVERRNQWSA